MIKPKTSGFTLIEAAVAMLIMLLCLSLLSPMIRGTGQLWAKSTADKANKELMSQAMLKMSPYLRNALRVDVPNSGAHNLVVVIPQVDDLAGGYTFPLVAGDSVAFYLSNITGSPDKSGTILWQSVNGVPNSKWSLRSGKGAIDFGNSNLSFSFDNPSDPNLVTITAYSTQWAGAKPESASDSTTVLLRNHQLGGL
jgi:type II secretory pathway component PulJ